MQLSKTHEVRGGKFHIHLLKSMCLPITIFTYLLMTDSFN